MRLIRSLYTIGVALSLVLSANAWSQPWPTQPIHIIVPVSAGGGNDRIARLIGSKLSTVLGQSIIVENHPGAGSMIGATIVARAKPDGYTLLVSTVSYLTAKFRFKEIPYDPQTSFTPITAAVMSPSCLVVNRKVPAHTVKQFVAYSIRNKGRVTFGSPGVGSTLHLLGELFNLETGAKLVHVPYKGVARAVIDLVAGRISSAFLACAAVPKNKNIRILADLDPTRDPHIPNVPTVKESYPHFTKPVSWYGVLGPANLPKPIVSRLHAAIVKVLHSPDVEHRLTSQGFFIVGNSPKAFAKMIKSEINAYGKIVKAIGMKPH